VIDDVTMERALAEADKQNLGALGLRAFVAATLRNGEANPSWSIVAISASPRHWTASEIKLIEEVTERTWAAVEKAKVEEKLRHAEEQYRTKLEMEILQRTAELKENKDLLQTVFDASPNSLSVLEILHNETGGVDDFKILILNASAKKNIGGSNVIGHNYSEIFPYLVESGVLEELIKAANTGEQIDFEKWYYGEGLHNCFRFIANKTGNLLLVTAENISARKLAEEGLKTNLTLLQQSEDLAKIGSWEYEIATGKFTWSSGMYELFGLPKGMSVRPEVYLDYVIDEDYSVAERIIKCFNEPQDFEETLCIKINGSVREINIKASIVTDEQGASFKLVGVDLDVTEAKEAEKTLREQAHFIQSANEALPDILFVMNLDTKEFTYLNHSFEKMLGYGVETKSSPLKNTFHLLYEEDVPAMLAHIEEMKTAEDSVMYEMEYRLKAPDGSLRWYKDRNSVFKRVTSGTVIEKIGIAQDITESKKAEQKLREINNSLRYANENLQQFASIASHDLQEPLRKLKLFASVLQRYEKELPEEAKVVVKKIGLTTVRMRQLITDVLQYSKIAYGSKEYVPTNLDHILQNVISDLDLLIADTKANIQYFESLPEIEVVPLQMHQLFYNLLTNALKFRKDGKTPIIDISYKVVFNSEASAYRELQGDYPYIEIRFSDNGIGFSQAYAEQIFQLFERLFSVDEYEGTGLGLALCKKIVENHNGHIYAESADSEGAKFYILLPISQKNRTGE
jgi:two-component system CheB/CheR fusion protein